MSGIGQLISMSPMSTELIVEMDFMKKNKSYDYYVVVISTYPTH